MDLRRIKKNIQSRNWEEKTQKQNLNYIKTQLKKFNLPIPKYIKEGKLTLGNINANVNKLVRAIDKQIDYNRQNPQSISMDTALKQLNKAIQSHNKLVYKKMGTLAAKYSLTENQLNYMIGRDVGLDGYKQFDKFYFRRSDTQFTIEDLDNTYFVSPEAVLNRIKKIKQKDKRLRNTDIEKELRNNNKVKSNFKLMLQDYSINEYMSKKTANKLMKDFNKLNGMQQEIFHKMLMGTNTKTKYMIPEDEMEEFQLNLSNKMTSLIYKASQF